MIEASTTEEVLYDHDTDPHEWHNLASETGLREIKASLRRELMKLVWQEP